MSSATPAFQPALALRATNRRAPALSRRSTRGVALTPTSSASFQSPSSPASQQTRPSPAPARSVGGAKRVAHVRAPVVDTRVAYADEAHHWLTVDSANVRTFERAAVAQADIIKRVEQRETGQGGAHHRWVLRKTVDPLDSATGAGGAVMERVNDRTSYVVMESFSEKEMADGDGATKRWLSAIEAVAPAVGAAFTTTFRYSNTFTSKEHDVRFDVNDSIVIVETVVAESEASIEALRAELEFTAQMAVAGGCCQEFCVLEAACTSTGLFKTIEVYKDETTLRTHMLEGQDKDFQRRTAPLVAHSKNRTRVAFKPVVFA